MYRLFSGGATLQEYALHHALHVHATVNFIGPQSTAINRATSVRSISRGALCLSSYAVKLRGKQSFWHRRNKKLLRVISPEFRGPSPHVENRSSRARGCDRTTHVQLMAVAVALATTFSLVTNHDSTRYLLNIHPE